MSDTFDLIMAAYQSVGAAQKDFDALVKAVKDKTVRTEGVILVEHDADGQVKVSQTGDHLGRKGLGWGGGVGVVVGLLSPPLLASVVVGGAAGGAIGKFAEHKEKTGLREGLGDKLKPGTAVIVAMVDDEDRLAAERALGSSLAKSVVPMEKEGRAGAEVRAGRGGGQVQPGPHGAASSRPQLRRDDGPDARPVGGRLDDHPRAVGRLLDAVEAMGDLDNTLIIYIWGDNGASMEGTLTGSFNETTFFNGLVLEADEQLKLIEKWGGIEEWGGFHTAPHIAAA